MRERAIGSVGVVVAGLLPALFGGPVFAAAMIAIGLVGLREFYGIAARTGAQPVPTGYLTVPLLGVAAYAGAAAPAVLALIGVAVVAPVVVATLRASKEALGAPVDWAFGAFGSLYLGIPIAAAIAVRGRAGDLDAGWLRDLASAAALGWEAAPRGLAWLLLVILVTWFGDTGAYLVGRAVGRRPLIPVVSPKKTVEGAVGGLAGSALAAALVTGLGGLGFHPLWGALVGVGLGVLGQVGDLVESLMKRQVGVKDSGVLIRGHGGMLDRIDALLFTLTGGVYVAALVDRVVR